MADDLLDKRLKKGKPNQAIKPIGQKVGDFPDFPERGVWFKKGFQPEAKELKDENGALEALRQAEGGRRVRC